MTTTLRDAMAAARINRMKTRVAKSWAARQIQADPRECQCLACTLKRTLRGAELGALDDGLWVARMQLEHCSLGEFEKARRAVSERIRHARAGNVPEGAHVVGSGQ